jgi:hypothetical protein
MIVAQFSSFKVPHGIYTFLGYDSVFLQRNLSGEFTVVVLMIRKFEDEM